MSEQILGEWEWSERYAAQDIVETGYEGLVLTRH